MSRKTRNKRSSDASEYNKGFQDGMQASFDSSELDAYYAGVGYGKAIAKNKRIGFNSEEERLEFEKECETGITISMYTAQGSLTYSSAYSSREISQGKKVCRGLKRTVKSEWINKLKNNEIKHCAKNNVIQINIYDVPKDL